MKKTAMTISYIIGDKLYLNITNACPCNCVFCIRNNDDCAYDSDPLWLEHMPSFNEIKKDIAKHDLSKFSEIVFCGYGEPTSRFNTMTDICDFLHTLPGCPKIRLNTNGLCDLTTHKNTPPLLKGKIDIVSVSLNAADAKDYGKITRPNFEPQKAYDAVCRFITECRNYIPEVTATVVDILSPAQTEAAKKKADELGVPLRIRKYEK